MTFSKIPGGAGWLQWTDWSFFSFFFTPSGRFAEVDCLFVALSCYCRVVLILTDGGLDWVDDP